MHPSPVASQVVAGALLVRSRAAWLAVLCAHISIRSAAGSARAAPTPGSPISSRRPSSRSRPSSATTSSTPAEAENGDAPKVDFDDEIDLRAEDDALVAAELEAAEARKAEEDKLKAEEAARRAEAGEEDEDEDAPARTTPRRRGRRGGRGRAGAKPAGDALEGTFDHGEEGYGLWLDPAVADNPIYAEHWAGHRPVEVLIDEDQIVIRRSGGERRPSGDH